MKDKRIVTASEAWAAIEKRFKKPMDAAQKSWQRAWDALKEAELQLEVVKSAQRKAMDVWRKGKNNV